MGTRDGDQATRNDFEKVDAIAKILGVTDATSYTALRQAFDDVALPVTTTRHAALRALSAREVAMCREMGVEPVAYLQIRRDRAAKTVRATTGHLPSRAAKRGGR